MRKCSYNIPIDARRIESSLLFSIGLPAGTEGCSLKIGLDGVGLSVGIGWPSDDLAKYTLLHSKLTG